MTAVRVQVTQQDIDNGEPGEPCRCPVALALRRILPDGLWPWVNPEHIELDCGDLIPVARLDSPTEVSDFIFEFDDPAEGDDRYALKPFGFDLDVPDDLLAGAS